MSVPGALRISLAALLLFQGAPALIAHTPHPHGMACCRGASHSCSGGRCRAAAATGPEAKRAATPLGACVLDVGGCRHAPATVATSPASLYLAASGSGVAPLRGHRTAAIAPRRDHAQPADPPVSPPPRG